MISKKKILSLLVAGTLAVTPLYAHAATDLGGTVTSYGSENGKVILSLTPVGGTEAVKTLTVTGTSTIYVMDGLDNGEYILKVSKYNHGTREYNVTVSGGELIQDVELRILGDVNGDGKLSVGDTAKCYAHVRGTSVLEDDYARICADVSGDGKINVGDTGRIYSLVRNKTGSELPAIPADPVKDNESQPILIEGADSLKVDVAAGHLVYYKLSQVTGMNLTVSDPMAYVIYNGKTYEAQDDQVVIEGLPSEAIVAVGNRSVEDLLIPTTVNFEPGHELNPVEIGGTLEFEAPVAAGGLSYFNLFRLSETNLTIADPTAYVIYNGVTYEAQNGVVTVPDLYSANTITPILIAIGNHGSEDRVFAVDLSYDEGHQMNPIPLKNGKLTTECAKGNSQGVYYSFTATKDGSLTIKLNNDVDCNITITSDIVEGGTRSESLNDEEGRKAMSFEMVEGETVSVCIVMNPVNGFDYPEGTVNTTIRFT